MHTGLPLIPEVGILGLVPNRWCEPWMPRHHVMHRLARYFNVAWMNPPAHWRHVLASPRAFAAGDENVAPGFAVLRFDYRWPRFYRPGWLRELAVRARHRHAVSVLSRMGATSYALYLWRPEFEQSLHVMPDARSIYHMDDEYTFSPNDPPMSKQERRVIAGVDQVFIHSPGLMQKKGHMNPLTTYVPNGVDYHAFATPRPEPHDLGWIPRPRIGYTGWLKRQLDWDLLIGLARRHADWSFVFVGPRKPDEELDAPIAALSALPNVHMLGPKDVGELSAYPQHFDVCIMPYQVDGYTNHIYPMKLHEYLASGRPVVGSPIRTLADLDGIVSLPAGQAEWSGALLAALEPRASSESAMAARREVARRHDWDALVARIAFDVAKCFGGDIQRRFEAAMGSRREAILSMWPQLKATTTLQVIGRAQSA